MKTKCNKSEHSRIASRHASIICAAFPRRARTHTNTHRFILIRLEGSRHGEELVHEHAERPAVHRGCVTLARQDCNERQSRPAMGEVWVHERDGADVSPHDHCNELSKVHSVHPPVSLSHTHKQSRARTAPALRLSYTEHRRRRARQTHAADTGKAHRDQDQGTVPSGAT